VSEPSNPRRFGDCGSVSGFGGLSQIRLRPSLFRKRGYDFVQDVLLHEMIHQWQQEVTGEREDQYFGHGPTFRDKANEIGAVLGLGRVRGSKKRGPDADRPNCCRWPHCVRGYPDAKRVNKPLEERAARMVRHLGNDSAREFARIILDVLTSKDR
jgi:predicted SprT family Zn-dependent metalloprotease